VNFFGAVAMTRAVLPYMRAQQSGAIVQISSMAGSLSFPGFGAYSASKFALEGISEALSAEVAPFGVKVLIVKPGAFRTAISSEKAPATISIGVYDDAPCGQLKNIVRASHNQQRGDPARAAEAVDIALQAENPPLRLLLGTDAAVVVPERAQKQLVEYAAWDHLARSTDFAKW
jgi:NAD(P)-dependent dehydrogenase (short-subunit alcohol dehydrogenase family)